QTALRLLADRHDGALVPALKRLAADSLGQLSLEALWALYVSANGLDEDLARKLLNHSQPQIRLWTVRLLGDEKQVSPVLSRALAQLARREPNVEVRAQLACTANRLPARDALPIVAGLLGHPEDAREPRLPLLCWWALESKCESDRDAVVKLFEDSPFWTQPMVEPHLLERVMRRYAAAGTR